MQSLWHIKDTKCKKTVLRKQTETNTVKMKNTCTVTKLSYAQVGVTAKKG